MPRMRTLGNRNAGPQDRMRQITEAMEAEDIWYVRRDFRCYATPDQVSSVGASVLRLNWHYRELATTFD
jgi:hypothetical protein